MATFPTILRHVGLTQTPIVTEDTIAFDPTIRSQYEGGYVITRARHTRLPRRWSVKYVWTTTANKALLLAFEEARTVGADSFTWTYAADSTAYTVRFLGPFLYIPVPDTNFTYWTVEFKVEEV